jgi:hypothetical protein
VKKYLDRPEVEWIQLEAPALRLIDETLWQAAHRRLDRTRALYAGTGGRPPLDATGRTPELGVPSRASIS